MIEAAVYLGLVLAIAGVGVWVGIILAGRIDRRMASRDVVPPAPPPDEEPS